MASTMTAALDRETTDKLTQDIDTDTYFRNFYLPWVIMDVFFDYVDTVIDQCVYLRIADLKKVTRRMRELHADYRYMGSRFLDYRHRRAQAQHMEQFTDDTASEFNTEYNLIKWKISHEHKLLHEDRQTFYASVYMAICVYLALKEFCKDVDKFLGTIKPGMRHSIIPDEVEETFMLLNNCTLDCVILPESDLKASARRLLATIREVRFTEQKEQATP